MPWLTINGNDRLAVDTVLPGMSAREKHENVAHDVEMAGLSHTTTRRPAELSGGVYQRINLARALAMNPEVSLLDEPPSALDALTCGNLTDEIVSVRTAEKQTCILITYDVDEAILLADRVVMITNGPQATIGKITKVDQPCPRARKALLEHPDDYSYRQEVLDFLEDYEHGAKPKSPSPKAIATE